MLKKKLETAFNFYQAGDSSKAADIYRQILSKNPSNFNALYYLAIIEAGRKNLDQAKSLMARALTVQPSNIQLLENYATILFQTEEYDTALKICQKVVQLNGASAYSIYIIAISLSKLKRFQESIIQFDDLLKLEPGHFIGINERGSALAAVNQYDAALASYEKAIKLQPQFAEAYLNKGILCGMLNQLDQSLAAYDKALALKPDLDHASLGRGNVLRALKRYDEALAAYSDALAINPAEAWLGRGNVFFELKRCDEALAAFDEAIALKPDLASAWNGRGNVLYDLKRHQDASLAYDRAIALQPDLVEAWLGCGNVFISTKRHHDAITAYDRAIELKPDLAEAWASRGAVFYDLKCHDEAIVAFDKALALDPDFAALEGLRLFSKMNLCDWKDFAAECEHLVSSIEDGKQNTDPFSFGAISSSPQDQLKCAQLWVANKYSRSDKPLWQGERYNHDRIRVAYLSADFCEHPVSYLMAGVLEQHDRNRIETIAISFGPDTPNDMLTRLKGAFDRFIDVKTQTDADIAKLLRDLELDIAVDLMGYTAHSRTGIFAYRPAPIQVNYLGYPGTMGANFIDYLIADPILIPESRHKNYLEKIVHLPNSYMPNDDSKRVIAEKTFDRAECGLPRTGFVFCCFNNAYKINPDIFDSWAGILKAVEGSVLWLSVSNEIAMANLSNEMSARGVNPERIIFAPRLESSAEHLARHRLADLFLDTSPYNAHTTASDALWAGLPVITRIGETFAGRVAASLLTAIGLPEMVTQTQDEYEKLTIELVKNPSKLALVRNKLSKNRLSSPLFNTQVFTRHLERAYEAMHQRQMSGLPPDHIQVPN